MSPRAPIAPTLVDLDGVALHTLRGVCCEQLRALGLGLLAASLEDETEPDKALVVRACLSSLLSSGGLLTAMGVGRDWMRLYDAAGRHLVALERRERQSQRRQAVAS